MKVEPVGSPQPPKRHRVIMDLTLGGIAVFVLSLLLISTERVLDGVDLTAKLVVAALSVISIGIIVGVTAGLVFVRTVGIDVERVAYTFGNQYWPQIGQARIISDDEVANSHESKVICEDIWVVTYDLHKDCPDGGEDLKFDQIVANNVKRRNIRYTYLVFDSPENRGKAYKMLSAYSSTDREKLTVLFLATEQWDRLPYTEGDFAIYNPTRIGSGCDPYAVVEWPSIDRGKFWLLLESRHTDIWSARVDRIIKEAKSSLAQQ